MDRTEKIRLSGDTAYCHCFKQGLFARFYEQSLYWFSFAVKTLKPMPERVKGGETVLYGGLPVPSFEKLLADDVLQQVETTEYGWIWPYAAQNPLPENAPGYSAWRTDALAEAASEAAERQTKPGVRNILAEIAAFNLAAHTPMQAMNALAGWQEALRNREGTG